MRASKIADDSDLIFMTFKSCIKYLTPFISY